MSFFVIKIIVDPGDMTDVSAGTKTLAKGIPTLLVLMAEGLYKYVLQAVCLFRRHIREVTPTKLFIFITKRDI